MAHEFESGVFNRQPAWHDLGKIWTPENPGDKLTPMKALELGDLLWEVELIPIEYPEGVETGHNLLVRDSDDAVFGVVGSQYQPIQNVQGMNMLTDLVDTGDLEIETAIALRGGKLVVLLARRPEPVLIAGEENMPYIMAALRHAEGATTFLYTPTRVVCANTYRVAIHGAQSQYTINHTPNAEWRLQEAREALKISYKYTDALAEIGNNLALDKISDRAFDKFLKDLVENPPEDSELTKKELERDRKKAAEIREAIKDVYKNEDDLGNIRGTKWGAFQSVVAHDIHYRKRRSAQSKMTAILDKDNYDQRAMDLLLA